jgi:hypothetical protein
MAQSWTLPTYILNYDQAWNHDALILEHPEDEVPLNGIPHPLPGENLAIEGEQVVNFINNNVNVGELDLAWEAAINNQNDHEAWPMPNIPHQILSTEQSINQNDGLSSESSSVCSQISNRQLIQSSQTVEREDLTFVDSTNPAMLPAWISTFFNQNLRDAMNTALPHLASQGWWNNLQLGQNTNVSVQINVNYIDPISGISNQLQINPFQLGNQNSSSSVIIQDCPLMDSQPSEPLQLEPPAATRVRVKCPQPAEFLAVKQKQVVRKVYRRKNWESKIKGIIRVQSKTKASYNKKRVSFGYVQFLEKMECISLEDIPSKPPSGLSIEKIR